MSADYARRRLAQAITANVLVCCACICAASGVSAPQELAQLRAVKGHFDGATWNSVVDAWQGRKHVLMQQLANEVRTQSADLAAVKAQLGTPDAIVRSNTRQTAQIVAQAKWQGVPAQEIWLYNWRGKHDQLAVSFARGRVVATGWLYTLEQQ